MNYIRKSEDRGAVQFDWLDTKHSFSFGSYHDPRHMGFSALRVINDDTIAPGTGFDMHGHQDMEIITYVTSGALQHKDSMGNEFVVAAGDVQRMSAGTGIMHSEFNASTTDAVKLLQIWIQPDRTGLDPSYEQAQIQQSENLTPLVTSNNVGNSLKLHQDAGLYRLQLQDDESYQLHAARRGYLHLISGVLTINGETFSAGDAIGVSETVLDVTASGESIEALWFELP